MHLLHLTDGHAIIAITIDPQFDSADDNDLTSGSAVLLRSVD